jgi:hypothetical protein
MPTMSEAGKVCMSGQFWPEEVRQLRCLRRWIEDQENEVAVSFADAVRWMLRLPQTRKAIEHYLGEIKK